MLHEYIIWSSNFFFGRICYVKRTDCFKWVEKKVKESNFQEQVFIVYPLIEESANFDAKAVLTEYENLKNIHFKDIKTELLHGRLKEKEKGDILDRFRKKEFNILVSTSVIEVGIDIPDATVMIIEDAHRFGLAQLHQLRGRVGRGEKQAYACFLFDELKGDATLRLEALRESEALGSGFVLSNRDLEIRGAGDILGKKQSGTINSVGYGLYTQLLYDAVEVLKGSHINT